MKVGAAVAVARRGGQATAYDDLHKYFGISGMAVKEPFERMNFIR